MINRLESEKTSKNEAKTMKINIIRNSNEKQISVTDPLFLAQAIKFIDDSGKKQSVRVWYNKGSYTKESLIPIDSITIYARGYGDHLPKELNPINDSEPMTDYFDKDRAIIQPDNEYYPAVLKAWQLAKIHADKIEANRQERFKIRFLEE